MNCSHTFEQVYSLHLVITVPCESSQVPILWKWTEGVASGDPCLVTWGFPQDIWSKYRGWPVAMHGAGNHCQGCADHQHHCCSHSLSKTIPVNDCIKDRRKKRLQGRSFHFWTHANDCLSTSPMGIVFHLKSHIFLVRKKMLWKPRFSRRFASLCPKFQSTATPVPPSSSHHTNHTTPS